MREELTIKQLAEAIIGAAVSCDASTNTLNIQLDGWSERDGDSEAPEGHTVSD